MKRLLLLLFAFAFWLTDASAVLKTVSFTTQDLIFMGTEAVLSKDGVTIVIPYTSCVSSAIADQYATDGSGNRYPQVYQFYNGNSSSYITVKGSSVREIRWYELYPGGGGKYSSPCHFSSGQPNGSGSMVSQPGSLSDGLYNVIYKWTGNYSGSGLKLTTEGTAIGVWRVEVDYEYTPPTPSGYVSELNVTDTWTYSKLNASTLSRTFNMNQYLKTALSQNGYDASQTTYDIDPSGISYVSSGSTSGLVASTSSTSYQNVTVNLQSATPMYGQVKLSVSGRYKNNTSIPVTINITINCIPELGTPTFTVPNQTKTYAGSPVPFTISQPSSPSSGAFTYSFGTGLTSTGTNTCTAANVGSYTVNVTQAANGWYNPGFASATLTVNPAATSLAATNYTTYPDEYFNIASKLITSSNNKTTPTFYYRKTGTSTWTKITGSTWPLTPDRTTYDVQICYDADNTNKVAAKPFNASATEDAHVYVIWRPFKPVYKDYKTRTNQTFNLQTTCFDHNEQYSNTKTPSFRYRKVGATSWTNISGTTWPASQKGEYQVQVYYPEDDTKYVLGKNYDSDSRGYDFKVYVYEETVVTKNTVEILRGSSYSLSTLMPSTNNTKAATKYYYRKYVGGTWAEHSGSTFQTTSTTPTGSYTFQAVYPSDETNFIAQKDFVNNNSTYDGVIGVFEPVVLTCKDAEKYTDESLNLTSYIRTVNNKTTPKFYYRKRGDTTWSPLTDYTFSGKPVGIYEVFVEYPNRDRTNWIWDRTLSAYGKCDFTVTVKQRSSVTGKTVNILQGTTIDLKTLITSSSNKMEPEFYHRYLNSVPWTSLPYSTFATYSTTPKGAYRIQICYPYDELNGIDAKPFNSTSNLDEVANAYVGVFEPVKLVANDQIVYNDAAIDLASFVESSNHSSSPTYYYRKAGAADWTNSSVMPSGVEAGDYDVQVVYETLDGTNYVWTKLFDTNAVDYHVTVLKEEPLHVYYNIPMGRKEGFCDTYCHIFLTDDEQHITDERMCDFIYQKTGIKPAIPLKANPAATDTYTALTAHHIEVVDANDQVFKVNLQIHPETFWAVPSGFTSTGGKTSDLSVFIFTLGNDNYTTAASTNDDLDFASTTTTPFAYYTKGAKPANGNATTAPTAGTYYKFTVYQAGMLTVGIKLDKRNKFYILEEAMGSDPIVSLKELGSELETWNGTNGTITIPVNAGKIYYLFSTDAPLGFYGYNYDDNPDNYFQIDNGMVKYKKYFKQ